jgi:ferredoxin
MTMFWVKDPRRGFCAARLPCHREPPVFRQAFAQLRFKALWGGVKMAYQINDECISCGNCVDECPVNCISEGDSKYVINEDDCISCGSCAGVCPVGAPVEA